MGCVFEKLNYAYGLAIMMIMDNIFYGLVGKFYMLSRYKKQMLMFNIIYTTSC